MSSLDTMLDLLNNLDNRFEVFQSQLANARDVLITLSRDEREAIAVDLKSRFCDPHVEPDPYRRAAMGRVLGLLDADNRKGIGVDAEGLPDIDWVEIPQGSFLFGEEKMSIALPTYFISRYHITYKQFQQFLDADDGFVDARWWEGLAERKERYEIQNHKPVQVFSFWNHPFDDACWYDAIAFCRWWSYRLGGTYDLNHVMEWKVRLATEQEWEKAARGTDGRNYPWGDEFISGYANFDETDRYNFQEDQMKIRSGHIGKYFYGAPSALGIFPQGASPYGVMDMIGTMWDYTLTEYRHGKNDDLVDYYPRVMRGGTWFVSEGYCNTWQRTMAFPHARNNGDPRKNDYSFRVVTLDPNI